MRETTPVGRELDAIVAEKVMGWKWYHTWLDTRFFSAPENAEPHVEALEGDEPEEPWWLRDEPLSADLPVVPLYSTDIAAAWLVHCAVMDRLFSVRRRYYEALQRLASEHSTDGRRVAWPDVFTVLRHRMPEAICRAALEAVGVGIEVGTDARAGSA